MTKNDMSYIQTLKPTVWIGKNGFSEEIAAELKHQLKARGVVKVKWLASTDMNAAEAAELAKMVSAEIIALRGKTAVLGAKNRSAAPAPEKPVRKTAASRRGEILRRTLLTRK